MAKRASKSQSARKNVGSMVYANAPLAEVVFEVRFSGEPAVECRRDDYYRRIKGEFPQIAIPNAELSSAPSPMPYRFVSVGGDETLMAGLDRFAYSTRRYGGYAIFGPRALSMTTCFCNQFRIRKLERTGLRFINVIPFLREGGAIPWKRYFTAGVTMPETTTDDFMNVSLGVESRTQAGLITTRIAVGKSVDERHEVFILDFDFAKTGVLHVNRLKTYLLESHDHTKKVFEGIVTDEYKAVMRGEVVQ